MLLSRTMICKGGPFRHVKLNKAWLEGRVPNRRPHFCPPREVCSGGGRDERCFDGAGAPPHICLMAILKIARMGHPVLMRRSDLVADPTSEEIKRLVADMIETMIDADGAGLAAPQVHIALRVVVFQATDDGDDKDIPTAERFDHTAPLTVLINPLVEILNPNLEGGWEGCLSVPGLRGWVERPRHIRYSGVDTAGKRIVREARGFHARVVQHECDHLDGVLFPRRMYDLSKLLFESEVRHWKGNSPICEDVAG